MSDGIVEVWALAYCCSAAASAGKQDCKIFTHETSLAGLKRSYPGLAPGATSRENTRDI